MRIHRALLNGLVERVSDVFQLESNQIIVTSRNDKTRLAADQAKQQNGTGQIKMPRMYLVPNSFSWAGDMGYKARQAQLVGVIYNSDDDDGGYFKKILIPCGMRLEVFYQTESFDTLLDFVADWACRVSVSAGLSFTMNYGSVSKDIKVIADNQDITIPELDATVDNSNPYYEAQTSLVIHGFLESVHPDANSKISAIRQLVQNLEVQSTNDAPEYNGPSDQ